MSQLASDLEEGLGQVSSVKQLRPTYDTGKSAEQSSLILKALANNASDVRNTVSNSLSADLRQRPLQGYSHSWIQ